jgi:hypothetical protein
MLIGPVARVTTVRGGVFSFASAALPLRADSTASANTPMTHRRVMICLQLRAVKCTHRRGAEDAEEKVQRKTPDDDGPSLCFLSASSAPLR